MFGVDLSKVIVMTGAANFSERSGCGGGGETHK